MYKIQTFNAIAKRGLALLEGDAFHYGNTIEKPSAYLLRSQDLHQHPLPESLLAVARAGAGVNNIPVELLTKLGIPVFNTPGANANAVKELVLCGLLMAARHITQSLSFTTSIAEQPDLASRVEQGKKQFKGFELPGRTIAVIGLGAIGVKVANAAEHLGLNVIGFDPGITIERALELSANVTQADSLKNAVEIADFVTVHVPFNDKTRHLINQDIINLIKPNASLLNFARAKIVDEDAVLTALSQGRLNYYVTDFPNANLMTHPHVIALPHLGASTQEAEDNCAVMAVNQLKAYLQRGEIENSVNFPKVKMPTNGLQRLTVINKNIPNMVGQISTVLGEHKVNINDLINKSRNEIAYSIVDVNNAIEPRVLKAIQSIEGVIKVRVISNS